MPSTVILTPNAAKQMGKAPRHVARKLLYWMESVERDGLHSARKQKGYHDERLQGKRWGQRSIRLSQQWRAIYAEEDNGTTIYLIEVIPHAY